MNKSAVILLDVYGISYLKGKKNHPYRVVGK